MAQTQHTVDILIKARDEASRAFGQVGQSANQMTSILGKAAGLVAGYFSAQAIANFIGGAVVEWEKQEVAIIHLTSALRTLGPVNDVMIRDLTEFANKMQNTTGIMDEEIEEAMKLGVTIGHLSGESLKQATIAAIGLSKAFNIDLDAAMRLVAKGAVGISTGLKRLGIDIKDCKTEQELYNRVMETGNINFRIATEEIEKMGGTTKKLGIAWKDFKENVGEAIKPETSIGIKAATIALKVYGEALRGVLIHVPTMEELNKRLQEQAELSRKAAEETKRTMEETIKAHELERKRAVGENILALQMQHLTEGQKRKDEMEKQRIERMGEFCDKLIEARRRVVEFGKSEEELFTIQGKAAGAPAELIKMGVADIRQERYLTGQKNLYDEIGRLRDELLTKNMSMWERMVFELKQQGIGGYPMSEFEGIVKSLTGLGAVKPHEGGVSPLISRFLTIYPGAKYDYQKQVADNTKEHSALLKKIEGRLADLLKSMGAGANKIQLTGAEF